LHLEPLEDRCVPAGTYQQVNLFSDIPGLAQNLDPNLVNGWGISVAPGAVWVSSNGADSSVVYAGGASGNPWVNTGLVVSIPGGAPTGQAFNPASDFVVSDGAGDSGKAFFIFASENGFITGWNPFVPPPPPSTQAQVGAFVDNAVFKGIALGSNSAGNFLFATDFRHGQVDVFDTNFNLVPPQAPGGFHDSFIPAGYAPFGIQNINGKLYVTYAQQDEFKHDDVKGMGHGFIDVYDTSGNLLQRLVFRDHLNSPWGLALAPSNFGLFSNDLLVSNFGDGRISAYDPTHGTFVGYLRDPTGHILTIQGLWGIAFGNGTSAGETNQLLFSAGPNDEADGLFGFIQALPGPNGRAPGHGSRSAATASATPVHTLLPDVIRDGRPGLPAAATFSGAVAAKPVGDTTGGHSIATTTPAPTNGPGLVTVVHVGHNTPSPAQAIDAVFAAFHAGGGMFGEQP
jgi:uncharacterized protein (TIGR03118 family)